jgi:predicted naringenin-chalcone synthase
VLADYGNMSVPTVLFVLKRLLASALSLARA